MKRTLNFKFLACLLAITVLMIVGIYFLHHAQVQAQTVALLEQSKRFEEEGDKDKALDFLERFLMFFPQDDDALAKRGLLLEEKAKKADAPQDQRQLLQKAFAANEQVLRRDWDLKRKELRRRQVDIAMDLGQINDAKDHLKILHQSAENDLKSAENAKELTEVAELKAKLGEFEALLGRCELANRKDREAAEKAAAMFEKAREHAPNVLDNFITLAALYRVRLNDPAKADKVVADPKTGMVAKNKDNFKAYLARAQYWIEFEGKKEAGLEKANNDLAEARKLAPKEAEVLLLDVELKQAHGQTEDARKLLQQGIKDHAKNPRMYLQLFALERKVNQPGEALKIVDKGLGELPDNNELLFARAELLLDQNKEKEVEKIIDRLNKSKFARAPLSYLQARVHLLKKEWGKAAPLLEQIRPKIAAESSLAVQINFWLGFCYEQLDNPEQAILAYQEAVKGDYRAVRPRVQLGSVYRSLGRFDKALSVFQAILKLKLLTKPEEKDIRLMVARTMIDDNLRLPQEKRNLQEVDKALDEAEKLMPAGAAEIAILRANRLLLENPKDIKQAQKILEKANKDEPEYWIAQAGLKVGENKLQDALEILKEAQKDPKLAERVELTLTRIAILALLPEKEARPLLDQQEKLVAKATESNRLRLLAGIADAYMRLGALDETKRLWNDLARENPEKLGVRLLLFDLALSAGQEKEMFQFLSDIKRLEGGNGHLWHYGQAARLVWKARPKGNDKLSADGPRLLKEARDHLEEADKKRPKWFRVSALKGKIDELERNVPNAIANYQQAVVDLGDRRPAVVRRLVELLLDQKQDAEAEKVILKLLDEEQTLLRSGLGKLGTALLLRKGEDKRAEDLLNKSVSLDSKEYKDHLFLARILWGLKKIDEAEKKFQRARDLAANIPETWVSLVSFLADTGKKKEAEKELKEASKKLEIEVANKKLPRDQVDLALAVCNEKLANRETAEKHFVDALKLKPNDPAMLQTVAAYFLRTGQLQKAEPHLNAILEVKELKAPEQAWARRGLARVLASSPDLKQYQKALSLLEKNLKANPDNVEDKRAKAMVLSTRLADRENAIRLFKDIEHKLNPEELIVLANLYEADNNWRDARLTLFMLVTSAAPNQARYQAYYADRLLHHKEIAEAESWIGKLEKLEPKGLPTYQLKARLLKEKGKHDQALALILEYTQNKDANLLVAALILDQLGQDGKAGNLYHKKAEELYRKVIQDKKTPDNLLLLARFLGRQGRIGEALDLCGEALKEGSAETVLSIAVGLVQVPEAKKDQRARVEGWLKTALAKPPASLVLRFYLADLYNAQERYADMITLYWQILKDNGRDAGVLNNLAFLLALNQGETTKALQLVDQGMTVVGESPELLDTRALIYLTIGKAKAKEAVDDLNKAIAQMPLQRASQYFHRARAHLMMGKRLDAQRDFDEAKRLGLNPSNLHALERPRYEEVLNQLKSK
jgi:tetratricopeptide (TPR) repeat protein